MLENRRNHSDDNTADGVAELNTVHYINVVHEKTPQERRQAKTRDEMIDATIRMIVERGVSGFSIRALADRLDYTPGALYTYFPGKDDLVDAARGRCFARLNDALHARMSLGQPSPPNPAEQLLQTGMAYIEYAADNPQEYHLMFMVEPSGSTRGDKREEAMRSLLDVLKRGIAQGVFVTTAGYGLNEMALHCWATVHGIASLQTTVLSEEAHETSVLAEAILKRVVLGLTGQSQKETSHEHGS
jgi:AcrR family transcriptional regulator